MGKRKRVPPALHAELSEYSSLLRALRTNDTLDVTKHIVLPPHRKPSKSKGGEASSSALDDLEPAPDAQPDDKPVEDVPPEEVGPQPRKRKRDTWTRWPLLVKDVHVPEWGLEDEVEALMRVCLREHPRPAVLESADAEEPDEAPPSLPHLTQSASNFLSSILALIALHTPARSQSMQDRLNIIGWQNVLEIVAASGDKALVDANMMTSVKARMEAIYTPYKSDIVDRVTTRVVKSRAAAGLDRAEDAIFVMARPNRPPKRQEMAIEEDVDSDDLDG
ncbi:hypothetical protein DFH09DRAFT_1138358 [Mycena vulgaris]|nr:hypothetical protein DFH09DRAFT_1138358 [Mycena vulgaris]